MLRTILLLLTTVVLSGCCGFPCGLDCSGFFAGLFGGPSGSRTVNVINSAEVSRTILIYSEKLKYEKGLCLEDSVVYYESQINRIRLDFSSMDSLDLWEARELLVDVVEGFLGRINENAAIYSNLRNQPFNPSNLEIYIRFPSFFNVYVDLQYVGLITLRNGISNFIGQTGLDCNTDCWQRRSEYYFQTRNFVEFRRQGEALYKPAILREKERNAEDERNFFTIDMPSPRYTRGR